MLFFSWSPDHIYKYAACVIRRTRRLERQNKMDKVAYYENPTLKCQYLYNTHEDEELVIKESTLIFKTPNHVPIKLSMDGIWDYSGKDILNVSRIEIEHRMFKDDGNAYYHIDVYHDGGPGSENIYTDKGFEKGISDLLNLPVMFSEYLQQCGGVANMETV